MPTTEQNLPVRHLTDRVRRLFSFRPRRDVLSEGAPKKKGLIITFCVLASCLLWFTFSMRETYTQFFDFPTQVRNLPDDLALTSLPPPTVRVQVEGEGIQLLRLYYNPPTVPIDAALTEVDLQVIASEVASNVRPESVTPARYVPSTDVRTTRRIPVRSRARIATEAGYQVVGRPQLDPDSVTVEGAASILERLEFWPTASLGFSAVQDTLRRTVELSDTLVGLVSRTVGSVHLTVDVLRFTDGSRQIEVRVRNGDESNDVVFDPATTTVSFQVPITQYDEAMEAAELYAFVPYESIRSDTTGRVHATVNVPDDLLLRQIRILPNSFRYYYNVPGPE